MHYIRHNVGGVENGQQKCVLCGELIADYNNVMVCGDGKIATWKEGALFTSGTNPKIFVREINNTDTFERCTLGYTKTGVMVTAEMNDEGELGNAHVNFIRVKGEDWRIPVDMEGLSITDADHWLDVLSEGMIALMQFMSTKGRTDADILRNTIKRLEDAFVKPANITISKSDISDLQSGVTEI